MTSYGIMYRLGLTPWENYGTDAADSIAALLDRETTERASPPGRALDLGCGRAQYTRELTGRGWEVVGIDNVPRAIEAADSQGIPGASFVVGSVTDLASADLGTFDFFLDVGCFQHLHAEQRAAAGRGVSAVANAGATLLMLEFQPTPLRSLIGGVSQEEIQAAFEDWEMLSVEPAETTGLGWPMSRTSPQWYRLRRPA